MTTLAYFGLQKNLIRFLFIAGTIVSLTWALANLVLSGSGALNDPAFIGEKPKNDQERKFPALTLNDLQDQPADVMATHAGKYILVNYWATWCTPCIAEIPSLVALKQQYESDRFSVVLISLDFPKNAESLRALMDRSGIRPLDTLYATDARQWSSIGARGLPFTVLIDPEGQIVSRITGGLDWMDQSALDFLKPAL